MRRRRSLPARLGWVALAVALAGVAVSVAGWRHELPRRNGILLVVSGVLLGIVSWAWSEWRMRERMRHGTPEREIATFRAVALSIFASSAGAAWAIHGRIVLESTGANGTLAFDRVFAIGGVIGGLLYLVAWARRVRALPKRRFRIAATLLAARVVGGMSLVLPVLTGAAPGVVDPALMQLGVRMIWAGWFFALMGPLSEAALQPEH